MNDNKNLVLAVVLSALVLLGWSWAANRYFPTARPSAAKVENGNAANGTPAAAPQSQPQANAGATPAAPPRRQSLQAALASTPRIPIRTPSLTGSINLKGALLDDLLLVDQKQTLARDAQPVRLLAPLGTPNAYVASVGWTAQGTQAPTFDTLWTADGNQLSPGRPVTLSTQMPDGARYRIKFSIDDGYLFSVQQSVLNASGKPIVVRPIGLVSRGTKPKDPDSWTMHVGPISVFGDAADYGVDYDTLDEDGAQSFSGVRGWLGFTDTYWLTALVPNGTVNADFRRSPNGGYQADYALAPVSVPSGEALTTTSRLFAGAKEKAWLDRYEDAGVPKLTKAIDWGWFEFFMRPIFDLLMFLFKTFGNFGVAIIALTFIVRGLMFPIAQKQFQSMAAMRKLQPKMKAIQERFKDDKQRQQQEILKLYQTEKINPAAGCLPLLLQIPVFYALYKVLTVSVEMRHQPFVLWIKDLSAPDPLTPINLFGLLDFTPPAVIAIGVLPILVGFTQWLTMKLNPQPMDPMQQKIFAWMPWILVIVMAPFAAGLQLYWMTNNVLSIMQQWWLYRRYGLHLSDTHPVET